MKLGILPCQGTCNVGIMTSKIAQKFIDNDKVSLICSLGLPLGIKNIIDLARVNDKFIALNGCTIKCASKALDSVEIKDYTEIILTYDFDILKSKVFDAESRVNEVEDRIKEVMEKYFAEEKK